MKSCVGKESLNNYFPHFTCGSCSVNLAIGDFPWEEIIKNCEKCDLYKRDIKVLGENLYIYRNIFIESEDRDNTFMGKVFRMRNRKTWHEDIISCCDEIDEEI